MATTDKPAYKVTIKLEGAKSELISEAMAELRERAGEYDQIASAQATLTIESWQQAPISSIVDAFETWLFYHGQSIDCEIKLQRPGVRPETREMLAREKRRTPMDQRGWEDE